MRGARLKTCCRWLIVFTIGFVSVPSTAQTAKPLVLQEMSWAEVKEYLKSSDMVIIPLGSTEQHGPHLPLGTDFYEALELTKRISSRTQVIVAPVILAGYSSYHTGFPGTLSLKPETLEAVLFETALSLIKYGFRRFLFFNYHGGNSDIEGMVIEKINQTTPAVAVRIGIDAHFWPKEEPLAPLDFHAGVKETSIMVHLKPELVDMKKAKKPKLTFSPQLTRLKKMGEAHPELEQVLYQYLGTPAKTGKKGASHELSNNGIWTMGDPRSATDEKGKEITEKMIAEVAKFITVWKKAEP